MGANRQAGSKVDRPHELESGGKECVPPDARDAHDAVLEWLA
jgi:hypothetical protein